MSDGLAALIGREGAPEKGTAAEVARLFLRLGFLSFGGPAAHIALMRVEIVERRRWIGDRQFLDLVGAVNLMPGPNSTELGIYLGYLRAGWPGLIAAGVCFILPAMSIVLGLAWAYTLSGAVPAVSWLLYGVKPVVVAILVQALWAFGRTMLKGRAGAAPRTPRAAPIVVAALALVLYLGGANNLVLLLDGVAAFVVIRLIREQRGAPEIAPLGALHGFSAPASLLTGGVAAAGVAAAPVGPGALLLTFLKIGSVLYGSGYVLLAFLRADLVDHAHWLTMRQLLDAVAVGQVTPGPVFATATFIGYVIGGVPGALAATIGIFLPAFVFVAILHRVTTVLQRSSWSTTALDGATCVSWALMAGVTLQLAGPALSDGPAIVIALVAASVLVRWKPNTAWVILAGALSGLLLHLAAVHY